jgi:hypothetical protein
MCLLRQGFRICLRVHDLGQENKKLILLKIMRNGHVGLPLIAFTVLKVKIIRRRDAIQPLGK